MIREHLLSELFMGGALLFASGAIMAQDDQTKTDENKPMEEVVVTGVRYSLTQAVQIKRNSMPIVDAIVQEDLGKFPDNNVVEAMQRIPGVQVTNRGGGEISTVSIRGLGDVTTTINGRNIFTAETRQVALADIPATLVNRVDVYKSRSPENIARGLAGQIDIHTNRPFDFDGFQFAAQTRASYEEQPDKIDPNASFLISDNWDTNAGRFGALLNMSYARTNWLNQEVDAGAAVPFRLPTDPVAPLERLFPPLWQAGLENGLPYAEGSTLDDGTPYVLGRDAMFQPHVRGERARPAWNLSLQWAPNDTSQYTFEAFYNGYQNLQHNSLFFTFVDWWGSVDPNDPVEIYSGTNVVRSRYVNFPYEFVSGDVLKQRTDSYLYALSGDWDISDNLKLKSEVYFQDSQYHDRFFAMRADKVSPRLFVDFNTGEGVPYVEFFDDPNTPQDESDLTDSSQWNLAQLYDNGLLNEGHSISWTGDAEWSVDMAWIKTIKFGLRYDDRTADSYNFNSGDLACAAAPNCQTDASQFPGLWGVTTGHFDNQARVLTSWAIPTQNGLLKNKAAIRDAWGYAPGDMKDWTYTFNIDEKKTEGYVQADFSTDTSSGFVDGRFGARFVDQSTNMDFPDPTGGPRLKAKNSNTAFLPSLMVRWGMTDDLLARFSYTEVFELPTFAQLNPYINYVADVTNIGYGTASGGNKDLKPIRSKNIDISLEWYFAEGSVLYGTWFKRDITDDISNFSNVVQYDDPNDNPDRGLYDYVLAQPDNVAKSQLDGWEFGLTYFPDLQGWLNGLGLQFSYTILNSSRDVPETDAAGNVVRINHPPILGVSDNSYSVILAYDRDVFSARLSWFHRDAFYDRVEAALFANPISIWKSPEQSLDFQATWHVSDQWTLTFDGVNLTEPVFHENYGNHPKLFNFHNPFYTRSFAVGVRYTM
jgi:iron complex outermembrane recepter protein